MFSGGNHRDPEQRIPKGKLPAGSLPQMLSGEQSSASGPGSTAGECEGQAPATRTPTHFLRKVLGRPVVVKLNNGTEYRGTLVCLDGYLNIVLENSAEFLNGELKRRYGDTLLRGSNVLYVGTIPD